MLIVTQLPNGRYMVVNGWTGIALPVDKPKAFRSNQIAVCYMNYRVWRFNREIRSINKLMNTEKENK